MELTAAIKTLEKLKTYKLKENFKLRTDSKYVIEGYTKWIINWKRNGWKTSSGKSVQNLDLWQKIDQLRINGLVMEYVKGHSGDKQNDRVDKIATNYSKGISLISTFCQQIFELIHFLKIIPEFLKVHFFQKILLKIQILLSYLVKIFLCCN